MKKGAYKNQKLKPAVFLDRDGTINEDVGYFCSHDQFQLIPRALDALRLLQDKYVLFIVTNQSGVARHVFTESELIRFNQEIEGVLKAEGIHIQKTYYCPHLPEDGCLCHKPSDFFLREAEQEFHIDLKGSVVAGDHPHDIEMAHRAGASAVYLLTGHGTKHRSELDSIRPPDLIAQNIYEAAVWIMNMCHDKQEV
ncbi:MAG: D-glycero-alpha-D-manno-heptose-1,7-bisphosphate 7-phosphatase [Candidatus Omnitrophota bacterium]